MSEVTTFEQGNLVGNEAEINTQYETSTQTVGTVETNRQGAAFSNLALSQL